MSGDQLLLAFDEIVSADLFPISASTTSSKLHFLNVAMDRVMGLLGKVTRSSLVSYQANVTAYPLAGLVPPVLRVHEVHEGAAVLPPSCDPLELGWNQNSDVLEIFGTFPVGTVFRVTGIQSASPIVASSAEIVEIPKPLHLPIAQLAVVYACGAIEDTNEQNMRLAALKRSAMDVISVYSGRQGRNQF